MQGDEPALSFPLDSSSDFGPIHLSDKRSHKSLEDSFAWLLDFPSAPQQAIHHKDNRFPKLVASLLLQPRSIQKSSMDEFGFPNLVLWTLWLHPLIKIGLWNQLRTPQHSLHGDKSWAHPQTPLPSEPHQEECNTSPCQPSEHQYTLRVHPGHGASCFYGLQDLLVWYGLPQHLFQANACKRCWKEEKIYHIGGCQW